MERLLLVGLLLLAGCVNTAYGQEIEKLTGSWAVLDFAGGTPPSDSLSARDGVRFRYQRERLLGLAHPVLLTELRELRLSLRSDHSGVLAIVLEDRDGAGFNYPIVVKAGQTTSVRVRPADFKLNEDARVKKPRLDAARLGAGFAIIDLGALTGAKGENSITIFSGEAERLAMPRATGNLVVDNSLEITDSIGRDGDIIIKNGARLKISAPRFALRGNIAVENGVLEMAGGVILMPQSYNHEFKIVVAEAARFHVRDALFITNLPVTLGLLGNASYEVENSEFRGGVTCTGNDRCRVSLERAKSPGEFVVAPGMELNVRDCRFVIVWLPIGANVKGRVTLPDGNNVADWQSGHGINVRVKNSQIVWGLVSSRGADALVANSDIYATGILFDGNAAFAIKNLHNKSALADYTVTANDRKLRFSDAKVTAWNFYAAQRAHGTIESSTFGEVLLFGEGRMEVRDSACDGSGGYIGASERAELTIVNSKINSLVIARDDAKIVMRDCEINGDVRATGRSTVKLIGCQVTGRIEKDAGATLIEKAQE